MKKLIVFVLCMAMLMSTLTACGTKADNQATTTSNALSTGEAEPIELTFLNYLQEYVDAVNILPELYKKDHPNVTIKMEIVSADYHKYLQTKLATGEIPDIFASGSFSLVERFAPFSEDLTNEPFWNNLVTSYNDGCTADGKLYASPLLIQIWGIMYNKDVFEKSGVTKLPQTLSELKDVVGKVKAAGYTPFSEGFKESWVIKQFSEFPWGLNADNPQRIQGWIAGNGSFKEDPISSKIFDVMTIAKENCQEKPADTDYMTQCTLVAKGQAAMMTQGDWSMSNIYKVNPDANVSIMPLPLSEDPNDARVYATAGQTLHIGKGAKNIEAAKEFMNWLYTSEDAKNWWSNDMKVMTAIKGLYPSNSPVLEDSAKFIDEGKSAGWGNLPTGLSEVVQPTVQKFIFGDITKEKAIDEISNNIAKFEP